MTTPAKSRRQVAGICSAVLLLLVMGGVLFVACRQVPDNTLNNTAGDSASYEKLVADARSTFETTPRSPDSVEKAAAKFADAFKVRSDSYADLVYAARVCTWLAEHAAGKDARKQHTNTGLIYVNTALKLDASGPEATFYHGVLAGFLGDLDNTYGLDAVKKIEKDMTALIAAGQDVNHGGPHRVYGMLLLRAPGPPTSIGSLRNAKKQLEQALAVAPDWPENHLYVAEMEFAWADEKDLPEFAQQARERLQKHLLGPDAKAPAGMQFEFAAWQAKARTLLAEQD
jgi:hypothetical protein